MSRGVSDEFEGGITHLRVSVTGHTLGDRWWSSLVARPPDLGGWWSSWWSGTLWNFGDMVYGTMLNPSTEPPLAYQPSTGRMRQEKSKFISRYMHGARTTDVNSQSLRIV